MRTLRVNATKVTLRKASIDNLYELESEEEEKKTTELSLDCSRILDLSVNPKAPNTTNMGFSELF